MLVCFDCCQANKKHTSSFELQNPKSFAAARQVANPQYLVDFVGLALVGKKDIVCVLDSL
jgi:hypothetical protein